MSEIKKINGYSLKDETARNNLETLITNTNIAKYIFPKSHSLTGDYNIIQIDNKNILIDCSHYGNWSEFKSVLDSYNISHIDIFICTHFHEDHIGNFTNLVENDYIDEETVIYFPKYTVSLWVNDSSYTHDHTYLEAMSTINTYNLTPIEPTEGMTIQLNSNSSLTFYNCDDAISRDLFTQQNYYNNASLIILFKHNDITSVYWGDCYNQPVEWLYNLGLLPKNIGIWKMGHHGVDYSGQSYFHTIRKLKINYAIQELGRNYLVNGHGYANGNSSNFEKLGVPVLVSAYNSDNIEIITEQNSINLIKGNDSITAEKSRHKNIAFYVDSENYSSEKQDGTETYPFSSLNQCLGNISRNNAITYTIHLADGDYNKEFVSYDEDKDISSLYGVTNTVIIQGNESDRTAVVLHHGFNIRNCSNIEIKNLTILNGGTKYGFDIHNSNVKISNVNYSIDTERTESRNIAISSSYSNLYIQNSLIDNAVHGIKASYCKLVIDSLQMTNLTYQALNLLKCIVQADSCSVTDSSVNLVTNQDNNFKSSFLNGISLWSGSKAFDSVTAENNTFSMNSRIDKFREIKIKYITDSNKYKSVIVPVTSNSMNTSIISSNIDSSNYLYNQQLSVSFSGTNVTISSGYRYKQNMTDPTITPIASNSNITITEILGL